MASHATVTVGTLLRAALRHHWNWWWCGWAKPALPVGAATGAAVGLVDALCTMAYDHRSNSTIGSRAVIAVGGACLGSGVGFVGTPFLPFLAPAAAWYYARYRLERLEADKEKGARPW